MKHLLAPSILSADFGVLKEQIETLNESIADLIHVDVMDGVFVPNISFGFPIIETIAKYSKKPLDIHLMIVEPDKYIERFAGFSPEYLTVHFETCQHLNRTINYIKSFNVKAGVALNPHTPCSQLEEVISIADLILIMSVNPGFGGQRFIPDSLTKIRKTKEMINDVKSKAVIEVDGGIFIGNIKEVVDSGGDIIVAGNSVFANTDILKTVEMLKKKSE
ncbi:MAG: ribulose-phosphate 3-epimerase [Bacteroidota bacterium]